jgi:hypothetical protein
MLGWVVVGQSTCWRVGGLGGGWTVIGWSADWLVSWSGTGCMGGFSGRPPFGRLGSRDYGLQLLATTES